MAGSGQSHHGLEGYGFATAEIFYHLPDYPHIIQTFVWQQLDLFPHLPKLRTFLDFWQAKLDGPLHSVKVMRGQIIKPAGLRAISGEFRLH